MKSDNQLNLFHKEVLREIACEFCAYFDRKKRIRLTRKEAQMIIDYYAGVSLKPSSSKAMDYTGVKVSGSGLRPRPSAQAIERIEAKLAQADDPPHEWDYVFDELINDIKRLVPYKSQLMKLIHMTFRDRADHSFIAAKLYISQTTYYRYRRIIIERAGVIANKNNLLTPPPNH